MISQRLYEYCTHENIIRLMNCPHYHRIFCKYHQSWKILLSVIIKCQNGSTDQGLSSSLPVESLINIRHFYRICSITNWPDAGSTSWPVDTTCNNTGPWIRVGIIQCSNLNSSHVYGTNSIFSLYLVFVKYSGVTISHICEKTEISYHYYVAAQHETVSSRNVKCSGFSYV
jgi:hypothetical protein